MAPPTTKPAKKVAVKQPLPVPERLKRLFTSLCAQIDGGHFNNAIKTCDKILRLEPGDADAMQTKLFLLLQTEQYTTALSLISEDSPQHAFERAYSLYRLHREPDTTELLETIRAEGKDDRGALHLHAQMNYRKGSFQEAFDIYNQLLDSAEPQSEEYSDILTNLQASQKHLDFINTGYLRALDELPTSLTANLESMPPPTHPSSSIAAVLASTSSSAAPPGGAYAAGGDGSKKVRMRRVPPGVIPGVTPPPDPERWLKKSERSTFGQGSKKKKGSGGGGATQGSVEHNPPPTKGAGGGKGKKKK